SFRSRLAPGAAPGISMPTRRESSSLNLDSMPASRPITASQTDRVADSAITMADRLGKLSPQSALAVFIIFGMGIWGVTLWWVAGTFTVKLEQNTQALARCASAMERIEMKMQGG